MNHKIDISVVAPLFNEENNLPTFFSELDQVLTIYGRPFEIIFVNDGSTDNSEKVLLQLISQRNYIKVINLKQNLGKAKALEHGFRLAKGDKVVIMDCDLQYDPKDIQLLVEKIEEGYDVVSGKRVNRSDPENTVLTSKIFRLLVRRLSGLNFSDYFSGLKCFKSNVISYLGVYGDLNRVFSVYAFRAGFKVCEIPITHRSRKEGKSRYNFFDRLVLAFGDITVLFYTVTISKDNLYKIGFFGFFTLSTGLLILILSILLLPILLTTQIFESLLVKGGILLIYIGLQLRIFELVGREFIARYEREYQARNKNIRTIYDSDGKIMESEYL
jgi:glycosyltransferase involved in cell wall biosynthesis